jgi:hypothetical protein
MELQWKTDKRTEQAAMKYCPIDRDTPAEQFSGRNFHAANWEHRVTRPSQWPDGPLRSSPNQIIQQFRKNRHTQAIAMVVSWGTMWRQPDAIWKGRSAEYLEKFLRECADRIRTTNSIESAWSALTGRGQDQLGWSDVMTSKTLHFLCRSLGFEHNPPVAIDGAVVVQKVWPDFRMYSGVLFQDGWREGGNPFEAYNRYMTAIRTWADHKNWTTTQVEATIFSHFKRPTT